MEKGLLMVHTGDGKGKTTAAIGLAIRAAGHGQRVCMIQFIKGNWKYGEMEALKQFGDRIDLHVMGRGFTWASDDLNKDKAIAEKGWKLAREAIESRRYQLVILDELTYIVFYQMVDKGDVIECLRNRPADVHVLVTGRGAFQDLIDIADMVTEMTPVKHHFDAGIKAQKGIEY